MGFFDVGLHSVLFLCSSFPNSVARGIRHEPVTWGESFYSFTNNEADIQKEHMQCNSHSFPKHLI